MGCMASRWYTLRMGGCENSTTCLLNILNTEWNLHVLQMLFRLNFNFFNTPHQFNTAALQMLACYWSVKSKLLKWKSEWNLLLKGNLIMIYSWCPWMFLLSKAYVVRSSTHAPESGVGKKKKKGKEIEHTVNSSNHCASSAVFISVHCQ